MQKFRLGWARNALKIAVKPKREIDLRGSGPKLAMKIKLIVAVVLSGAYV